MLPTAIRSNHSVERIRSSQLCGRVLEGHPFPLIALDRHVASRLAMTEGMLRAARVTTEAQGA
jgi:hypothetical protein